MSNLPNHPDLPTEKHLNLKEISLALDKSYEWCRRVFRDVEDVLVIPSKRLPGDKRRAYDDILVPLSVYEAWYKAHQVGGAR